jgi:hypothetical protein
MIVAAATRSGLRALSRVLQIQLDIIDQPGAAEFGRGQNDQRAVRIAR